jgi:CheY-like chemotaxis protein
MASQPILVVDDNPETREAVVRLLVFTGYPAVGVTNGKAALDFLHAQGASLVILDLAMPVMSGPAFLSEREAHPDLARIPVIVYSAYRSEELPNVCGYARKTDAPEQLLELVKHCRLRTGPESAETN